MPASAVSRPAESQAVTAFLTAASNAPSGLLVEGDAGIGKTTLLLAAVDDARERGFRVLSARSAAAESVLAYAVLADLLGEVEAQVWAELSDVQRLALDRALLREDVGGPATDQLEVASGFLAVVEKLAAESPLLLAIDDLQWLDTSSKNVVAFVARRLSGSVGVLGASRPDPEGSGAATWLQLPRPDAMARITVSPFSLGRLHSVVTQRLGRPFPRSTMVRIQEISAGNPFYALELGRAIDSETPSAELRLPGTLADLVRARIGSLDADVQDVLLAASCVAAPTVELVAAATGTAADRVVELLEPAEASGIVGIEGQRLRFEHPLLARGVYTSAATTRRRAMHRRLAEIVDEPELKARHLARAATSGDAHTLESLDAAAESAGIRGAPAAAAELLELAVGLGGDTPKRRIRLARYHFNAGDGRRARALLEESIARLAPGTLRGEAMLLLGVVRLYDDSFLEAADLLERALEESADNSVSRVRTLVMLAFALFNCGRPEPAMQRADDAVASALYVDRPELLSEALGMRVALRFQLGGGLDEADMRRALEVNDYPLSLPLAARPGVQNALLLAWTGQLDAAAKAMAAIQKRCIEHGEESELIFFEFHSVLLEIWRANFSEAAVIAEDAMERALLLHGDFPRGAALTVRAAVAAYAGRQHDARRDAGEAQAAIAPLGQIVLTAWAITIVGFLEVSLGNYDAALKALEPLLSTLDPSATEIFVAAFVPDAVEAMIALNRLDDAEPLIEALEQNGSRLDRAWMLAVGARCRAMLLAARGDVDAATAAAQRAMTEHDRLPMPFERARTQLLLGQLQRRLRRKEAAAETLRDAVAAFDQMGTALWAERARAELARADVAHKGTTDLTPSEQRVAELAAAGKSNRDIASALFISPKTVEANLARIYRKLDIHSRAQLGRHITPSDR
jgi:DNA-binding CsgD family transcriptional regulator